MWPLLEKEGQKESVWQQFWNWLSSLLQLNIHSSLAFSKNCEYFYNFQGIFIQLKRVFWQSVESISAIGRESISAIGREGTSAIGR